LHEIFGIRLVACHTQRSGVEAFRMLHRLANERRATSHLLILDFVAKE
jgi:hypothetical protein